MHCKDVSVKDVDFALDVSGISRMMDGYIAYKRAEYVIFHNRNDYAIVRIEKKGGSDLLQPLSAYEIIALPEDIIFIEDPDLDVLNLPALAVVQKRYPEKTVIIKGMFSHVSFVKDLHSSILRIVDDIPPAPSKLSVLTKIALASGYVDHPIIVENIDIDLADSISKVKTEAVMFPCKVSGLKANIPYYFLDNTPKLEHEVTLIGCNLSKRIYQAVYGIDVAFINVCPADSIPNDDIPTIAKCCKIKNGHIRNGNTVLVPWGATVPEVVDAINDLFSE